MGSLMKLSKNDLLDRLPGRKPGPAERVESRGRRTWRRAEGGATRAARGTTRAWKNARRVPEAAAKRARSSQRAERWRRRAGIAAAGTATGAGAYFLDPNSGKRRRHVARDRLAALLRRGGRRAQRAGSYGANTVAGNAKGVAADTEDNPTPNDEALADRVRSEVFRPAMAPKGAVNINAVNGIVYLRGEVKRPEQIRDLVSATESIDGVKRVENLLHVPA